jgi:hypothetical protein
MQEGAGEGISEELRPFRADLPIDIVPGDGLSKENVDSGAKMNVGENGAKQLGSVPAKPKEPGVVNSESKEPDSVEDVRELSVTDGPETAERVLAGEELGAAEELFSMDEPSETEKSLGASTAEKEKPLEITDNDEGAEAPEMANLCANQGKKDRKLRQYKARQRAALSKSQQTTAVFESPADSLQTLVDEGMLARNIFSVLIERFNLPPAVILHALYVNSGSIDDTVRYLSEAQTPQPWSMSHDQHILMQLPLDELLAEKGKEAVEARRRFLVQVCEESVGTLEALDAQLRQCKQ